MGQLDRTSMLGLILSLSLGVCILFLAAHEFLLGPVFEFLAMTSLILGWFIVAPAYYFLTRPADTEAGAAATVEPGHVTGAETTTPTDPMETLRRRYAAGELSEAEFERKLERLLETEDRSLGDSVSGTDSGLNPNPNPNSAAADRVRDELDRELERESESD